MVFGEKLLRGKKEIPDVYCAMCQKNAGPSGYVPKKEWDIEGKLCSSCFGNLLGAYEKNSKSENSSESPQKQSTITENLKLSEKCPKCNNANLEGAKFCSTCGTNLQLKCIECGNCPPEGSKFCNQCGNPV